MAKKTKKVDRITKEEILMSLTWIAVILSIGVLLNGTRYLRASMVILVIGLITSLIIMNYNK